jgi:hypothetical protein
MMTITITAEIKRKVDRLFEELNAKRGDYCFNPVTGGTFIWGEDPIKPQKEDACCALAAREWFAVNGPPDAPPLPLSHEECEDYRRSSGLMKIVGFFGRSVRKTAKYDIQGHPSFEDFARGLMASNSGLWRVESDEEMRKRFPPRHLPGMTGGLYWEPPQKPRVLRHAIKP